MTGPIPARPRGVTVAVLVQVVTNAGLRCECTRPGCHPGGDRSGRCRREHPTVRLLAAPRDVTVPDRTAWRVPVTELSAWCPACLAGARRDRAGRTDVMRGALPLDLDACGREGRAA